MYKRITLFTFICLLALAGIAQNKDTYTILLSGASFAEPNNKWFEMGCRALHAIPINRAVSAESIAHTANKMLDGTLYTPEEFDNIDVFVLMQVHEKDVYNEANLKENYKDYKNSFLMLPTMPFAMIMSSSATYQTVITRNSIQNPDITTLLMGNLFLLSYVLIGMTVVLYSTLRSENWQKMGFPVVEFDRYIGFSKKQKHPVTGNNIA